MSNITPKLKKFSIFCVIWKILLLQFSSAATVQSVSVPEYTNQSISSLDILFSGAVDSNEAADSSTYQLHDLTRDQILYHNVTFNSANSTVSLVPQLNIPYNLNTWQAFRYPDPKHPNHGVPSWNTDALGQTVTQAVNADPSFFYSSGSFLGEKAIFTFRTADNDDDFLGFFFGYSHDSLAPFDKYYMFTWNNGHSQGLKNAKYMPNGSAHLIKVSGMSKASSQDVHNLFWIMNVDTDSQIERLQMEVNGAWQKDMDYVAVLEYGFDLEDADAIRIKIKIYSESEYLNNGVPLYDWDVLDSNDPFTGEQIGFFNHSQGQSTYQQVAETTILSEGDYQLTIKGGVDGIAALDGNGDGTSGDDFVYNFNIDQTAPVLASVSSEQASILLSFVDASPLIINPSAVASDWSVVASGGDGSFVDGNEIEENINITGISLMEDQKTVRLSFDDGLPSDYYRVSLLDASVLYDSASNEVNLSGFPIVHQHNNPPEVAPLAESFYEGIKTDFSVSAIDADDDVVSVTAIKMPSGMTHHGDGNFSWTPAEVQGGQRFDLEVVFSDDGDPSQSVAHTFSLQVIEVVEFEEPLIFDTLLTALGANNSAMITAGDLAGLTGALDLSSLAISDITGLEYLTGITVLNLSNNQISDISVLSGLTNLTDLNLSSNWLDLDVEDEDAIIIDQLVNGGVAVDSSNQTRFTLNVLITGDGTVSLNPDQTDYGYADQVNLTATPSGENLFIGWSGDIAETESTTTFEIKADTSITAEFADGITAGDGDGFIADTYGYSDDPKPDFQDSFNGPGYRTLFADLIFMTASPVENVTNKSAYFSCRLFGNLEARYTGPHTFEVPAESYADAAVYLNGDRILYYDNSTVSDRKNISDPINLVAGQLYTVEIFYRASSLGDQEPFYVNWELPNGVSERIPQDQLYSGYDFVTDAPAFASAVVAKYFDANNDPIDLSGSQLEFGSGMLPLNSKVELSAGDGETIRYTLDGSDPDINDRVYSQAIAISGNTILKARAYSDSANEGSTFTGVYTVDDVPPVISDLQLPDANAADGFSTDTLRVGDNSGRVISVNVQDDSPVVDVRFYLTNTNTGSAVFLGADEQGSAEALGKRFEAPFNIFNFADGNWNLKIVATDFFGNVSTFKQSIKVVITAPQAPIIDQPRDGTVFANGQITISGTARIDCTVQLEARLINSNSDSLSGTAGTFTALGTPIAVSSSGEFSLTHTFADNQGNEQYELRAIAIGRNHALSPFTDTVKLYVDSAIPPSPENVTVTAEAGGNIRISWDAPLNYSGIIRAYRIQVSDDDGANWTFLDEVPGHITTYLYKHSDQTGSPPFLLRVLAVNAANTTTLNSAAQVTTSVVPDEAAPQITQIKWLPQDDEQFDTNASKYGPGLLTVQIELNEAVSQTPYFALTPPGLGLPYKVDLIAINDFHFEGVVAVEDNMPSGNYKTFAVLSDVAGNQSRSDDPSNPPFADGLETSLTIDTEAPQLAHLNPSGQSVFKNEAAGTTLSYTFAFDEDLAEGSAPIVSAEWGNGTTIDPGNLLLQHLGAGAYQVDVALSATDGYDGSHPHSDSDIEQALVDQALLTVFLEVEDRLGNSGFAAIPSVLVYRNTLPQTAPPVLHATVLAEGKIRLEWEDVPNASHYKLMRVDSPEDEILAVVARGSAAGLSYEYTYTAPLDGDYSFYVFGEREDPLNPGTYLPGYSLAPVSASADGTAPAPAHTVTVQDANPDDPNAVLRLDWQHDSSGEVDHFDVYRTDVAPAGTTSVNDSWDLIHKDLSPNKRHIFDSQPFAGKAWYVVVATDAVGNEVLSANFDSIDITVVPPAKLEVMLVEGQFPVLSWTAVDAVSNGGSYSVYYQDFSGALILLEAGITELNYTDTSWDGRQRTYWVESVKGDASARRDISIVDYTIDLPAGTTLYRGLPTPIRLSKAPDTDAWNFRLYVYKSGNEATAEVYFGELNKPFVDFGLNPDDSTAASLDSVVRLEMWPKSDKDLGESVWFEITRSLPVENRLPVLSLKSDVVSRGAIASDIELSVGNPSESSFKIQFSEGHVALRLYDTSGNLLSQTDLSEEADRTILGEDSLTLESLQIEIPENAPETVILQAELSQYHHPQTGQVFTPETPIKTRLTLSTVALSYAAEVTTPKAVDAATLLTDESIEITGRAIASNGSPRAAALVTLGLENGAYKRTYSLVTDSRGKFRYVFDPDGAEPGGVYTVWAKHPALARTPDTAAATGSFNYKRITVSPEYHTVRIPRNYTQGVPITVTWPEDTTLSDFTVEAVTFSGEELPLGLAVTLPSLSDPAEGETALKIIPQIAPLVKDGAPNEANLLFRVSAKLEGSAETTVLGKVPVYCYFSQTFGQLIGPSKLLSLSVLREMDDDATSTVQDDSTSLSFKNIGLIPLTELQFDVMQKVIRDNSTVGYEPAPKWLKLTGALPETLAVNESVALQLTTDFASHPEASLPANGTYRNYVVLAKSEEAPSAVAEIELNVTSDSSSGLEIHVVNAYFGFDASLLPDGGAGLSIPAETLELYREGIPDAKITLQQDDLHSPVNNTGWTMPLIYKGSTRKNGKVDEWTNRVTGTTASSIPAGRYQMTVEAPKHDTYKGTVVIKPGISSFTQIPLSYGAVTVEWEVREVTLQDRYEVTIETLFETKVPTPVVTTTPSFVELPNMCPGDVFEVELLIENHGVISALDVENPIPESDDYLKIEPLVDLGATFDLPAQQSIRIAYLCICIKALPGSECN